MFDAEVLKQLPERTGRHRCIECLRETPLDVFLRNDHLCDDCAASGEEYPLATTPGERQSE